MSADMAAAAAGIRTFLRGAMDRASIPGLSVAVLRDGQALLDEAFGVASLELGVPVTPATVFPLASVTKAFTAALVLGLVEEGAMDLDAPVAAVLDGLPDAWGAVTVRQLLSHTSGLPDAIDDPARGQWLAEDHDEALRLAMALPLSFAPGTSVGYSQTNFLLVGAMVEQLTAQDFEDALRARLLRPLGLGELPYGDARVVVPGRGGWYSRIDFSGPRPRLAAEVYPIFTTYPPFASPCAGLNATAAQLAHFVDRLGAGDVLRPDTVAQMWRPQALADGSPAGPDPSWAMGLGWLVETVGGVTLAGATGGASVALRHAVGRGLTVAVLTNCQGADPDGLATGIVERCLELNDPSGEN